MGGRARLAPWAAIDRGAVCLVCTGSTPHAEPSLPPSCLSMGKGHNELCSACSAAACTLPSCGRECCLQARMDRPPPLAKHTSSV